MSPHGTDMPGGTLLLRAGERCSRRSSSRLGGHRDDAARLSAGMLGIWRQDGLPISCSRRILEPRSNVSSPPSLIPCVHRDAVELPGLASKAHAWFFPRRQHVAHVATRHVELTRDCRLAARLRAFAQFLDSWRIHCGQCCNAILEESSVDRWSTGRDPVTSCLDYPLTSRQHGCRGHRDPRAQG